MRLERERRASCLAMLPNSRGTIHVVILFSLAHSLPMKMEQCRLGRLVVWLFRSVLAQSAPVWFVFPMCTVRPDSEGRCSR